MSSNISAGLESKTLPQLKEIAALYGLSEWDLYGPIRKKESWIDAIRSAQSMADGFTADTDKAVSRLYEWLVIEAPTQTPIIVNPADFQQKLNLSASAFWFALYALREQKRIKFVEPSFLEFEFLRVSK